MKSVPTSLILKTTRVMLQYWADEAQYYVPLQEHARPRVPWGPLTRDGQDPVRATISRDPETITSFNIYLKREQGQRKKKKKKKTESEDNVALDV